LLRVVWEKGVGRTRLGERGERCFGKDNVKGAARDSKVRIHTYTHRLSVGVNTVARGKEKVMPTTGKHAHEY